MLQPHISQSQWSHIVLIQAVRLLWADALFLLWQLSDVSILKSFWWFLGIIMLANIHLKTSLQINGNNLLQRRIEPGLSIMCAFLYWSTIKKHYHIINSTNLRSQWKLNYINLCTNSLQCFVAIGWACKKTEWWDAGVVMCLGQGSRCRFAYAQLMPLPLTISCSSKSRLVLSLWHWLTRVVLDKIQEGRNMVVCAYVCVCVCIAYSANTTYLSRQISTQFHNNKNTINVLSKYNIIVGSKNG